MIKSTSEVDGIHSGVSGNNIYELLVDDICKHSVRCSSMEGWGRASQALSLRKEKGEAWSITDQSA